MKVRSILYATLLTTISFCCALLVGEYTVRKLYPYEIMKTNPDIYEFDPLLGWTYKKEARFIISSPDRTESIHLRFNKIGIRDNEITTTNKKSILIVGDSTTGAIQVNEKDHFKTIIENEFNLTVINAGINGYNTAQSLVMMRKIIEKVRPIAIFYLFNPNDIIGNLLQFNTVGVYRYSKPYFTNENNKLIYKKVTLTDRSLVNSIVIDKDLLYCLEYRNQFEVEQILEKSNVFGKTFSQYKYIEHALKKEKISEIDLKKVKRAIFSCIPNPSYVKKIKKMRESRKPSC